MAGEISNLSMVVAVRRNNGALVLALVS